MAIDETLDRAVRTYSAAAEHYDSPTLGFWHRFGEETVARLGLRPGQRVLDLCCGTGESLVAAARAVGPTGTVLGVDAAEPMLERVGAKLTAAGLDNVTLRTADATRTGLPTGEFDAVICVFGVFFAADMTGFVGEMWRMVAPGGTLAITTWGPDLFEPGNGLFWTGVRDEAPQLYKGFNPWDTVTTPEALASLLRAGGVEEVEVEAVTARHPLPSPEAFWDVVLGTGYRGTVEALTGEARERVRARITEGLRQQRANEFETNVVYGTGRRRPE